MLAHFLDRHSTEAAIIGIVLGMVPQWLIDLQGVVGFFSVCTGLTVGVLTLREKLRKK
jgi:hypothetical protein